MIRHVTHTEIDRERWNLLVANVTSQPYAQSWYLDVVSPGWEALVQDDYAAVMPLTRKKKLGISYLAQPHFCQQLGVFAAPGNSVDVASFLEAIPTAIKLTEITLNETNVLDPASEARELHNYTLSLDGSYAELSAGYANNHKRNLRKAVNARLVYQTDQLGVSELIQQFRTGKGQELAGLDYAYYATLESIYTAAHKRAYTQLVSVETPEGELLAGAFFLCVPGRAVFLFSAPLPRGKELGAMPFLIDRFIFENAGKPMVLDFEGSVNRNLARFYKGFGAKKSVYYMVTQNRLPRMVKWLKANRDNGS